MSCLRPGGRAAFVDEDDRATGNETTRLNVHGDVPKARRTLRDGRTFDIVKVFWEPAALTARLEQIGWDARVRPVGGMFLVGEATPAP